MSAKIDLGENHTLQWSHYKGEERTGAQVDHLTPAGVKCSGFIAIEGRSWANSFNPPIEGWRVIQEEPLTLVPSLLCRGCGDHGYITNGCWVKV